MQTLHIQSLGQEDPLEKEMATHSSILAWEIPRTEESGGLQSMGLQRVEHDLATKQQECIHTLMYMWGCTCVCDREKRNGEVKANCQEKFEVFINLQMETGAVPKRRMKHFELLRHSSSYNCSGVEFAPCGYFLYTPVVWRLFKSVLMLPASALSQSDPGNAGYLNDLFMNLKLFYPKAWHAICNSKVLSPAMKLDFASQEKKERELDFLKNQHVG